MNLRTVARHFACGFRGVIARQGFKSVREVRYHSLTVAARFDNFRFDKSRFDKRWLGLLALLLSALLAAQDTPPFRIDVTLITVPCTVTGPNGAAVTELRGEDFHLYIDGAPHVIRQLWRDEDLPLTLGVIIDVSDSQRARAGEHQATVRQFLEQMMRPRERAFTVWVNQDVTLKWEGLRSAAGFTQMLLTPAGQPLGEPCATLHGRSICGGTALWNAVYAAARLKLNKATGSKALLVLSDGADTGSTHSPSQAIEEVERAEAVAYAIRYPDALAGSADGGLNHLAADTGGAIFDPPGGNLAEILSRIGSDVRSRYVIGFQPDAVGNAGGAHDIRLEVARSGVTVRARKQYFDPAR